jgi:hypothetical protein
MPELMLCDLQQTLTEEQDRIIVLAVVAPIKPAAVLPCQRCECQGRFIVSAVPHKMLLGRSLSRDGSRQGRVRRGKIAARRLLDPSEERRARAFIGDLLNRHDVRVWQYQGSSAARYGQVAALLRPGVGVFRSGYFFGLNQLTARSLTVFEGPSQGSL